MRVEDELKGGGEAVWQVTQISDTSERKEAALITVQTASCHDNVDQQLWPCMWLQHIPCTGRFLH